MVEIALWLLTNQDLGESGVSSFKACQDFLSLLRLFRPKSGNPQHFASVEILVRFCILSLFFSKQALLSLSLSLPRAHLLIVIEASKCLELIILARDKVFCSSVSPLDGGFLRLGGFIGSIEIYSRIPAPAIGPNSATPHTPDPMSIAGLSFPLLTLFSLLRRPSRLGGLLYLHTYV
ncbi:hypothetical protein P154DRAFT_268484 [Amniculicola lignicola CBS 123094]|uniref:Uncharacterized protein n=1 Tax=Amniculicola lignicola CBS 123094 TaxID=1392246 RepID=A0A6A5WB14_9PLEO|nr:hypothetical protein P154DRAFT_268484 [Amniculicola lignicola CBS 123094]